ncbi:unnamed protein product [Pseudo-nitzschia multistriata]|uniref:Uncharacterized protein n=1 Tax=Pseudo-nitzschia multistriata TaxID=183589 RepID=A0A448YUJ0_9STRA|nr:unnamed protein product [Pseudo-nitzschia multistriata]
MAKQVNNIVEAQKCNSRIIFGDKHRNTTILDIDTMENADNNDTSDGTYETEPETNDDDTIGSVDPDAVEVDNEVIDNSEVDTDDHRDGTATNYVDTPPAVNDDQHDVNDEVLTDQQDINIRYFFVTDRVKKGKVSIEYCSTNEIIADYFMKPL